MTLEQVQELNELARELAELDAEQRRLLLQRIHGENEEPTMPTVAQAIDPSWRPRAGATLGNYTLVCDISHGAMAKVFLARRRDDIRLHVAIKLLSGGSVTRAEHKRLQSEQTILASLSHKNIIQLLDGGVTPEGFPWLAMEWVEGLPLCEFADRHQLGIDQRLKLFMQACEAVTHCHQKLVLHRDLKPSHFLVNQQGEVKLIDFGIAIRLPDEIPSDGGQNRFLTPAYAPPELLENEALTTASDVYSLGVVLQLLLCGTLPFRTRAQEKPGTSVMQQLVDRSRQKPKRPSLTLCEKLDEGELQRLASYRATHPTQWRRQVRGDLDAIILRCLAPNPIDRYGSAGDLKNDLWCSLNDVPVSARHLSWAYRWSKWKRRHRRLVMAGLILMIFLSGSISTILHTRLNAARERDLAQHRRDRTRRTAAFLIDLFGSAVPAKQLGDNETTRQLLREAHEQLDIRFGDDPEQKFELLWALARINLQLNEWETMRALDSRGTRPWQTVSTAVK